MSEDNSGFIDSSLSIDDNNNNKQMLISPILQYDNGLHLEVCTSNNSKDGYNGSTIDNKSTKSIEKGQKSDDYRSQNNIMKGPKLDDVNFGQENDMLFGWKPDLRLKAPFPIYFLDKIRSEIHKIRRGNLVYKGFLPKHSYILHDHYAGENSYCQYDDGFEMYKKPNIRNQIKENLDDVLPYQYRDHDSVIFNSCFESGNLDMVIRRPDNVYELFLRVDSNTRGHTQWFYFTMESQKKEKITVKIVNLTKNQSIQKTIGKPYYSFDNIHWEPYLLEKTEWTHSFIFEEEQRTKGSTLKFDYFFESLGQKVYFCYAIPYTYTRLHKYISTFKFIKDIDDKLKQDSQCRSESGVDVPLQMISNYKNDRKEFRTNTKAGKNGSRSEAIDSIGTRSKNSNVFKARVPFYKNKKVIQIEENNHYIRKGHNHRASEILISDDQNSQNLVNDEKPFIGKVKTLLQQANMTDEAQTDESQMSVNTTMTYANTDTQKASRNQISPQKIQEKSMIKKDIQPLKKRPIVVIIARQHPGETSGSMMMHGMLEFLLSDNPEALVLRDFFEFRIIPMMNVDGVISGNWRTGLAGDDLNRCFHNPSLGLHPSVLNLLNQVKKWQVNRKVAYFFDLHGHSTKPNVFTYGPELPNLDPLNDHTKVFPKLISNASEMFAFKSCSFVIKKFKKTTARAIFLEKLGVKFSYTVEASTSCWKDSKQKTRYFSFSDYKQMGVEILQSLQKFLTITIKREEMLKYLYDLNNKEISSTKNLAKKDTARLTEERIDLNPQNSRSSFSNFRPSTCYNNGGVSNNRNEIPDKVKHKMFGEKLFDKLSRFYNKLYGKKIENLNEFWEKNVKEIERCEKSMHNNEGRSDSESSDEDIPKQKKKVLNSCMAKMIGNDIHSARANLDKINKMILPLKKNTGGINDNTGRRHEYCEDCKCPKKKNFYVWSSTQNSYNVNAKVDINAKVDKSSNINYKQKYSESSATSVIKLRSGKNTDKHKTCEKKRTNLDRSSSSYSNSPTKKTLNIKKQKSEFVEDEILNLDSETTAKKKKLDSDRVVESKTKIKTVDLRIRNEKGSVVSEQNIENTTKNNPIKKSVSKGTNTNITTKTNSNNFFNGNKELRQGILNKRFNMNPGSFYHLSNNPDSKLMYVAKSFNKKDSTKPNQEAFGFSDVVPAEYRKNPPKPMIKDKQISENKINMSEKNSIKKVTTASNHSKVPGYQKSGQQTPLNMHRKQYTLTKEYSMRTPVHHKSTREEETTENYTKPKNQPQSDVLYMEYDTLGNKCSYNNREHFSAGIIKKRHQGSDLKATETFSAKRTIKTKMFETEQDPGENQIRPSIKDANNFYSSADNLPQSKVQNFIPNSNQSQHDKNVYYSGSGFNFGIDWTEATNQNKNKKNKSKLPYLYKSTNNTKPNLQSKVQHQAR